MAGVSAGNMSLDGKYATGDSANPSPAEVARMKKKIATTKGLFTRTETKIKTLQVKGNESVGNTLLEKLDAYALETFQLYDELLEVIGPEEKSIIEDTMNAIDVDHCRRATSCLVFFTSLPVAMPTGVATRSTTGEANTQPRIQFREQQGLRPALLMVTSSMAEFFSWKTKFKAYFKASNMQLLEVTEQQAYAYSRMGPQLSLRMEGTVSATADLDDFLGTLEKIFLQIHPMFQRRLSWFQLETVSYTHLTLPTILRV